MMLWRVPSCPVRILPSALSTCLGRSAREVESLFPPGACPEVLRYPLLQAGYLCVLLATVRVVRQPAGLDHSAAPHKELLLVHIQVYPVGLRDCIHRERRQEAPDDQFRDAPLPVSDITFLDHTRGIDRRVVCTLLLTPAGLEVRLFQEALDVRVQAAT